MKREMLAVVACCVFLFSVVPVSASTYEGTFDPNQLYTWEWEVELSFTGDGLFIVKAKNPKNVEPKEVTFLVRVEVDENMNTSKKIILYSVNEENDEVFLLDEEKDHYSLQKVDMNIFSDGECFPVEEESVRFVGEGI